MTDVSTAQLADAERDTLTDIDATLYTMFRFATETVALATLAGEPAMADAWHRIATALLMTHDAILTRLIALE